MVVVKFRNVSESKELMKKLKRMHRFTKELIECVEDSMEDDDDDDDENYRYDEEYEHDVPVRKRSSRRYRRGM